MSQDKHEGLRYDNGKLRYDLVQPWSHEQMVRVLTKGAGKYLPRNWEKGMAWSKVIGSLKRHMAAIERGEDYDIDPNCPDCQQSTNDNWVCKNHTGELHAAQVACNAHFLTAYYKIYPQGDDRPHTYLSKPRIALDIDDVLADFIPTWCAYHNVAMPTAWQFDKVIVEKFNDMRSKEQLDDFYMSIPIKTKPEDIPFEPCLYVTARPVPSEITEKWLDLHGYPAAKVCTVGVGQSKADCLKEYNVDIFVDDNFNNFVELNNAGVCTFLFDACHNQRYDVGYKRIHSLKDLV